MVLHVYNVHVKCMSSNVFLDNLYSAMHVMYM